MSSRPEANVLILARRLRGRMQVPHAACARHPLAGFAGGVKFRFCYKSSPDNGRFPPDCDGVPRIRFTNQRPFSLAEYTGDLS